jgi:HK97 family phage major capsid protein
MAIHDLRAKRAIAYDKYKALANLSAKDFSADEANATLFASLSAEIKEIDAAIERQKAVQALAADSATEVGGQENHSRTYAQVKDDPYSSEPAAIKRGMTTNKGLVAGGIIRMIGMGDRLHRDPAEIAKQLYGERHPITEGIQSSMKALIAGVGSSGGFIIPPEYINEIIELLRPLAVVRSSNPRTMPMPRGTMTLPAQTSAAVASYGNEVGPIASSQPAVGQIIAVYHKLKALVPISNDLMRFADPAADALVRDDLVKVCALREDLAFMMGDGTQDSPRGFLSFANTYCLQQGGTPGTWLTTGDSTAAVGGNFITSNESYTLATVDQEVGGAVNKLDSSNVPDMRRVWFMHPRSFNYLFFVQNSLGLYPFREELSKGTFMGYPVKKSTQIPVNIWDANGANKDCSFVFLVEMTDALLLDAMTLELTVSREGSYIDTTGAQQNAFANDETLIRGIMEHDFQMRHSQSIAVIQYTRWAPAIS